MTIVPPLVGLHKSSRFFDAIDKRPQTTMANERITEDIVWQHFKDDALFASVNRMPSSIISLPITSEEIPDWQFVKEYDKIITI